MLGCADWWSEPVCQLADHWWNPEWFINSRFFTTDQCEVDTSGCLVYKDFIDGIQVTFEVRKLYLRMLQLYWQFMWYCSRESNHTKCDLHVLIILLFYCIHVLFYQFSTIKILIILICFHQLYFCSVLLKLVIQILSNLII